MADASGTPTSPDNIPTYATSADPPSGKGFNTAMAAIQAALTGNYVRKPAGISAGDAVIWNGSGWDHPGGTKNGSNFLRDDGVYAAPSGIKAYRKTTSKAVNTSTSLTDLLNAEITLAANDLGSNKHLRAVLFGDFFQNVSTNPTGIRFQLVVGATTVFDTNTSGPLGSASAARGSWVALIDCLALGATNSQVWRLQMSMTNAAGAGNFAAATTTFTTGLGNWVFTPAAPQAFLAHGVTTSAIDMTASQAFVFNAANGVNNVSYETRLLGAVVEIS